MNKRIFKRLISLVLIFTLISTNLSIAFSATAGGRGDYSYPSGSLDKTKHPTYSTTAGASLITFNASTNSNDDTLIYGSFIVAGDEKLLLK